MFRLIRFLFTGKWKYHEHKWKIINNRDLRDHNGTIYGTCYVLQCENCGDIKQKDVGIK